MIKLPADRTGDISHLLGCQLIHWVGGTSKSKNTFAIIPSQEYVPTAGRLCPKCANSTCRRCAPCYGMCAASFVHVQAAEIEARRDTLCRDTLTSTSSVILLRTSKSEKNRRETGSRRNAVEGRNKWERGTRTITPMVYTINKYLQYFGIMVTRARSTHRK